jgi:hypothetical protein
VEHTGFNETNCSGRVTTYKGQLGGNLGMNMVRLVPSFEKHCCVAGFGLRSPTPPSPDEKIIDTPRQPTHGRT